MQKTRLVSQPGFKLRKMTKVFSILFISLVFQSAFPLFDVDRKKHGKWIVDKNSSLSIHGETNVNRFQCDATEYLNVDTFFYVANNSTKKLNFSNSSICLDLKNFDCHSKLITNDFRKALNANESPVLKVTFLCLDQFPNTCNNEDVKGRVDIELAGLSKRFEICYTVKTFNDRIELWGEHAFTFGDFNLKAPKKMAGLVRTKETIKVKFHLLFKAIPA